MQNQELRDKNAVPSHCLKHRDTPYQRLINSLARYSRTVPNSRSWFLIFCRLS